MAKKGLRRQLDRALRARPTKKCRNRGTDAVASPTSNKPVEIVNPIMANRLREVGLIK